MVPILSSTFDGEGVKIKVMSQDEAKTIIFFDGVCNLCNFFVQWLIGKDKAHHFRYGSLQGETARQRFGDQVSENPTSVVVINQQGKVLRESEAVFFILRQLPWSARWGLLFSVLPRGWTDGLYREIAKRRYRIFGKQDSCRLPTESEKTFFLP